MGKVLQRNSKDGDHMQDGTHNQIERLILISMKPIQIKSSSPGYLAYLFSVADGGGVTPIAVSRSGSF